MADEKTFTFYSSEKKWVSKIEKYAESNPEVVIKRKDDDEGIISIIAEIPKKWIKISPPRKVNLTDEQRQALAERMRNARQKLNSKGEIMI